jgi:NifU-like protein involved in Fe-S cluster formation
MVAAALRTVMLAAEGRGALEGSDVRTGSAEHPVCGDVVELDVRVQDGRLVAMAWRAKGCPASTAVCAAAAALQGAQVDALPATLAARLQSLGGLAVHERHAERLFLDALASALAG